ncbi:MAG: hydroxymethylglutaryl-CoA synthase [Vicinamibacterales bacterium]
MWARASAVPVGIDALGVYPCACRLDIGTLCEARGLDLANVRDRLFCDERSVMGPIEDVVTLAVNAALPILTAAERDAVRLLVVATESGPDQEKPVSSWVHHYLGLRPDCRNFEVKHACYGATGALQLAAGWIASGVDPGAKALVINADHALWHDGGAEEAVLGAAGVAVLVSARPRVARLDLGWHGVHAHEIADIFRPAPGVETGDADESLLSYLDGVEAAYDAYVGRVGQPIDFDTFFAANVYHVPFGGLSQRAHLKLARRELGLTKAGAEAHWARKSRASLTFNRRTGGIYGGATFLALAGVIASGRVTAGDRVGIYSYGSGSCAEFYSVTIEEGAYAAIAGAGIEAGLERRRALSLREYEACERAVSAATAARDVRPDADLVSGLWDEQYAGQGKLVFRGIRDYYREYAWS